MLLRKDIVSDDIFEDVRSETHDPVAKPRTADPVPILPAPTASVGPENHHLPTTDNMVLASAHSAAPVRVAVGKEATTSEMPVCRATTTELPQGPPPRYGQRSNRRPYTEQEQPMTRPAVTAFLGKSVGQHIICRWRKPGDHVDLTWIGQVGDGEVMWQYQVEEGCPRLMRKRRMDLPHPEVQCMMINTVPIPPVLPPPEGEVDIWTAVVVALRPFAAAFLPNSNLDLAVRGDKVALRAVKDALQSTKGKIGNLLVPGDIARALTSSMRKSTHGKCEITAYDPPAGFRSLPA